MFSFPSIAARSGGDGGIRKKRSSDYQQVHRADDDEEGSARRDNECGGSRDRTPSAEPQKTSTREDVGGVGTLRRLFELARPERHLVLRASVAMAFGTAVSLAVPAFSGRIIDLSIGGLEPSSDQSDGDFDGVDDEIGSKSPSPFDLLVRLLGIMTIASFSSFFRILWQARAGHRVVARVRRQLYASMLSQEAAYFDATPQGDLISRLSSDADLVQSAVTDQALGLLRNLVISVGAVCLLFYTSTKLALVSVSILPPVGICARLVGRKMRDRHTEVRERHARATSLAEQALTCIRTVQQFSSEKHESQQYNAAINAAHSQAIETARMSAMFRSVMGLVLNLALLCVLGYGGVLVSQGALTPGDLASFVMYSVMMGTNISGISTQYIDLMKAVAAANRVFEIIDRRPVIPPPSKIVEECCSPENEELSSKMGHFPSGRNHGNPSNSKRGVFSSQVKMQPLDDSTTLSEDDALEMIEMGDASSATAIPNNNFNPAHSVQPMSVDFQQVSFSYPTRPDSIVLDGLNLSIESGKIVALVGVSGGGKSTIASLLTRLYDPTSGAIMLDGMPIQQMDPQELRRNIGIVVQEPLLFPTTIEANIRYGSPDATPERVRDAARLAFVSEFADKFDEGLETVVGPRGTQLSGGQKQRVAVARCILKDPPVLIFDEATSALDAESESQVQRAIDVAARGRTVILIAHRLSTIRNVDTIAVVKNGEIAEMGAFDDLVKKGPDGAFRQLMDKQLLDQ